MGGPLGFSARSNRLGPTFALVELPRAQAAFLAAPMLPRIAMIDPAGLAAGVRLAALIAVVLIAISALFVIGVLLLGCARPHAPDPRTWPDDHGGLIGQLTRGSYGSPIAPVPGARPDEGSASSASQGSGGVARRRPQASASCRAARRDGSRSAGPSSSRSWAMR